MLEEIKKNLSSKIDQELIDKILDYYAQIKQYFWLGKDEECLEKVGKFVEITIRILEYITSGKFTTFDIELAISDTLKNLEQLSKNNFSESIRIIIPRVLYSLYTFRSKRGGAHIKEVNPNHIDVAYIISSCDWIISELLRLYHTDDIDAIQNLINYIVERKVPIIEEFGDNIRILNPDLSVSDKILIILYKKHPNYILTGDLRKWIRTKSPSHVTTVLSRLDNDAKIFRKGKGNIITLKGIKYVTENLSKEI